MTGPHEIPDAPPEANAIEQADVAVAKAVAPVVDTPVMKVLGTLSEAADQPPLRALCAGLFALGLWRGDARLAQAAVRMLLAHSLPRAPRPRSRTESTGRGRRCWWRKGRYEMGAGDSHDHDESSFPSGAHGGRGGGGEIVGAGLSRAPRRGVRAGGGGGADADPAVQTLPERRRRGRGSGRGRRRRR
jgi:hypothetical protein